MYTCAIIQCLEYTQDLDFNDGIHALQAASAQSHIFSAVQQTVQQVLIATQTVLHVSTLIRKPDQLLTIILNISLQTSHSHVWDNAVYVQSLDSRR